MRGVATLECPSQVCNYGRSGGRTAGKTIRAYVFEGRREDDDDKGGRETSTVTRVRERELERWPKATKRQHGSGHEPNIWVCTALYFWQDPTCG